MKKIILTPIVLFIGLTSLSAMNVPLAVARTHHTYVGDPIDKHTKVVARRLNYPGALAVDDHNRVYVVENAGLYDSDRGFEPVRIVEVAPNNRKTVIYNEERVPTRSNQLDRTEQLHNRRIFTKPIDDMWWADGDLYVLSGTDVYRMPRSADEHIAKESYDDWHREQAAADERRAARYAVWHGDTDGSGSLKPYSGKVLVYEDPPSRPVYYTYTQPAAPKRYRTVKTLQKPRVVEHDWRTQETIKAQQNADRERAHWNQELAKQREAERERQREWDAWRDSVRKSFAEARASIRGRTTNVQSQRAVTEGNAFSEQEQAQDSTVDYEVRMAN
jgi:hypothetical protein